MRITGLESRHAYRRMAIHARSNCSLPQTHAQEERAADYHGHFPADQGAENVLGLATFPRDAFVDWASRRKKPWCGLNTKASIVKPTNELQQMLEKRPAVEPLKMQTSSC